MTEQKNHILIKERIGLRRILVTVIAFSALATIAIAALLLNIFERKQEGRHTYTRVVEVDDDTGDPAIWGKNFPYHYADYLKTTDQVRTRFGGSEAIPRTPTDADPRSVVARSKVEDDERLRIMWAGYPFAVDTREKRGHAYMLEDQTYTERQRVAAQPGACLNCHASTYLAYKDLGDGDIVHGFSKMNEMPFAKARPMVQHPVACIDCHSADTMELRITRPAFMEGIAVYKASQGIKNYDVNRDAGRQEMRAYVCAQCHVEYYFKGSERRLVFPWHRGIGADEILDYFDEIDFADWTHEITGAKVLKAQHPEFEMWSRGIHGQAGVTCVDCHMPYKRVGAMKITDHHIRSPVLNLNNACRTCHNVSESELKARVETIQERHYQLRHLALDALVDLIETIAHIQGEAHDMTQLDEARHLQRRSQFLIDFVEAENSMGFHAPQESARVMGLAIDYARKGLIAAQKARL